MYFEFESLPSVSHTSMSSHSQQHSFTTSNHNNNNNNNNYNCQPLLRARHRRLSSSSQSLNELFSEENVIENITPSQCDLYLITRKKLSAITTSDLRREVLLASIHRNITTSNGSPKCVSYVDSVNAVNDTKDKLTHSNDHQLLNGYQRNQFKSGLNSSTTSTSTTTIANTIGATKLTSTNMTVTTHSSLKKRSSTSSSSSSTCSSPSSPQSSSDYEEEWKTTIKRLKVVHGLDFNFDVNMDSEFEEHCDSDLNDLTNNFHRLKTPL